MRVPTWLKTTAAVTAAAGIGSIVTRPGDSWYRRLEKPSWQPPPRAFPLVWTPLYGLIAFAGARALDALADGRAVRAGSGGRADGAIPRGRGVDTLADDRAVGASAGGRAVGASAGGRAVGASAGGRAVGASAGGRAVGASAGGRAVGASAGGRAEDASTSAGSIDVLAGGSADDALADLRERRSFAVAFGANLALNAAWTAIFFGARRPRAALAEIALLNASNLDLLRRAWLADRVAGAALAPYVAWTGFATVLNAAIVRRNA